MMSWKNKLTIAAIFVCLTFPTNAFAVDDTISNIPTGGNPVSISPKLRATAEDSGNRLCDLFIEQMKENSDVDSVYAKFIKGLTNIGMKITSQQGNNGKKSTIFFDKDGIIRLCVILNKADNTIAMEYFRMPEEAYITKVTKKYMVTENTVQPQDSTIAKSTPAAARDTILVPTAARDTILVPILKHLFNSIPQPFVTHQDVIRFTLQECGLANSITPPDKSVQRIKQYGNKGVDMKPKAVQITGCPEYDKCNWNEIGGDRLYAHIYPILAYKEAKQGEEGNEIKEVIAAHVPKMKKPEYATQVRKAIEALVKYYKGVDVLDFVESSATDHLTSDINDVLSINNSENLRENTYCVGKQVYSINLGLLTEFEDCTYNLYIPAGQMTKVYTSIDKILRANRQVKQQMIRAGKRNQPRQKVTVVRVNTGLYGVCDFIDQKVVFRDTHYSVKTMDGYISVVNGRFKYDIDKNAKWKELLSITRSNCAARD